ncbi:MAG: amidohydrolase [Syntrophomonadaceae bacterium]|nr:amidohydrolase [Syntrophomonadaceae bacterium]
MDDVRILPMTAAGDFIPRGHIVAEGGRIAAVQEGPAPAGLACARRVEGRGRLAMPGFVNTHTHAAMTLFRGVADDMPLMEWLQTRIWPMEARLTAEDVYWGTLLCIVEMIRSGTTAFADMYFFMDQVARAVAESGMRAALARGLIGVGPDADRALEESRAFAERWHGGAQGRIQVMLGPHAPYTCPPDYLQRVMDLAGQLGLAIHIHLAETRGEVEDIVGRYGRSPVRLMEETGLFAHRVLAAHCVHLDDEDIRVLAERGVGVAHNPQSNMKLASGVAPVPRLLAAGVTVGLGTDGASSNNNQDMLDEVRSCALLHKVWCQDPQVVPAYQALEMATVGGARALGLEDVGMLAPGMRADIILVDLEKPHLYPQHDVAAHLVYAAQASDVDTVMVDGRLLMEERRLLTLDENTIMARAQAASERLVRGE